MSWTMMAGKACLGCGTNPAAKALRDTKGTLVYRLEACPFDRVFLAGTLRDLEGAGLGSAPPGGVGFALVGRFVFHSAPHHD